MSRFERNGLSLRASACVLAFTGIVGALVNGAEVEEKYGVRPTTTNTVTKPCLNTDYNSKIAVPCAREVR